MGAGVTVKFTVALVVPVSWSGSVASPPKVPVRVYVPAPSGGVAEQVAIPLASVVPVQYTAPLTVKVTGSFAMGALVTASVSVPVTVVEPL